MTNVVFKRNVNFHVKGSVVEYKKGQNVDVKELEKKGIKWFEEYVSEVAKFEEKKEGKKRDK